MEGGDPGGTGAGAASADPSGDSGSVRQEQQQGRPCPACGRKRRRGSSGSTSSGRVKRSLPVVTADATMFMAGAAADAEADDGYESVFNVEIFSDRVLQIEVVGRDDDAPESAGAGAGESFDDPKRRRKEDKVLRVRTVYVSSAILAAKSSFFFKLFSNGMKESAQNQAKVRIADSEENAFMELLRFMYRGKLTPTTDPELLVDIFMSADKFEVVSCMKLCCQQLIDLPMTLESAVWCLNLRSSISMAAELIEAARLFVAEKYKQFYLSTEFQDELMRVPLRGIVAILIGRHHEKAFEGAVFDFVLRWADSQYSNSEERRKILCSFLLPLAAPVYCYDIVPKICRDVDLTLL